MSKTQNKQPNIDIMVLGQGHSLMFPPVNDVPIQLLVSTHESLMKDKETKASYGLFGGGVNYNTFYPEVSSEDYNPSDSDFVEPLFRLLSACIVNKHYYPTDFSTPGVLEKSLDLLTGQTVYCDHDTEVGNAIGAVKSTAWQESFVQDGVVVPAGINGILKIDAKANPRIARGLQMEPPSIHSNSVTVTFKWEPSHHFDSPWDFYDKMGTMHEDGTLIRRIVTEIVSYSETSLVSHGADPFAQKIEDGKLNHIKHAAKSYYGTLENSQKQILLDKFATNNFDYYSHKTMLKDNLDTLRNSLNNINNTPQNKSTMDNEMILQMLLATGIQFKEGQEQTIELAMANITEMVSLNASLAEANQTHQETIVRLEQEVKDLGLLKPMAEIGTNRLKEVRGLTLANYKKLTGNQTDEAIITLISAETTGLETLSALNKNYTEQLEKNFPMKCGKCGSGEVSRASSINEGEYNDESSQSNEEGTTIGNDIATIMNRKNKQTSTSKN